MNTAGRLRGISSMATRALLAELARDCERETGLAVGFESVGGVDAARRVRAGEPFDVVVLAADAIDQLLASGHAVPGSRTEVVRSAVALALPPATPAPHDEDALRAAVLGARRIGYSTGPSGTALLALFGRWGIGEAVRERLLQAPPGVPVGTLVARGQADIGFQQLSELMQLPGIVVHPMPPGTEIVTTFAAARCSTCVQPAAADALLAFLRSPRTAQAKRRHGMEPA